MPVVVYAHAKINLLLDVAGRRSDGYHELKTIMQSLELHDRLELEEAGEISLKVQNRGVTPIPEDPANLVWQAAAALKEHAGINRGVNINLHKDIPVAAGLGGGSADAAAALRGLNSLWGLNMDMHELALIGAKIGSDVPFCIYGGTALVSGRGEKVTPLPSLPGLDIVLVKPSQGLSTARVYGRFDHFSGQVMPDLDVDGMVKAIIERNTDGVTKRLGNALETVAITMLPQVGHIKELLMKNRARGALVSGSGPTVFGIFACQKDAQVIAGRLSHLRNATVIVTKTVPGNWGEGDG